MISSTDRTELIESSGHPVTVEAQTGEEYGLVARTVYSTSYYLSFGAMFPTLLVASVLPTNNAVGWGLRDGALAAGQANRRLQTRTAAATRAAKTKMGDAYASFAARISRRAEAFEDAVAERRHRRRAATT